MSETDLESMSTEELERQKLFLETAHIALKVESLQRTAAAADASASAARVFPYTGYVSDTSVNYAIQILGQWSRETPECPIEVIFHSPGGSIFAGLALYDYLRELSAKGHTITTTATGCAASMAGVLLQAGDIRRMTPHSYLMIHEASSEVWGKFAEMRDELEFVEKLQTRCYNILASSSKLSAVQIRKRTERKDWWLDAAEARKHGFVDKITRRG